MLNNVAYNYQIHFMYVYTLPCKVITVNIVTEIVQYHVIDSKRWTIKTNTILCQF